MCYFVFVGIRPAHHALLVERFTQVGFQLLGTENADILAAFPKADAVSIVVHGGCSCDLYAERATSFDEAAARAAYQKKKWSAAKIERAIQGKRPLERPVHKSFREEFAVVVRATGDARLFSHSFCGEVDTERVVAKGHSKLPLQQYLAQGGVYPPDVVHDVRVA